MTTELEAAAKALRRAQTSVDTRRAELHRLIVEARDTHKKRQTDIAKETGLTREAIRLILKAYDERAAAAE